MQNISAQLLFPIRLDPFKLARGPLKFVALAESPRDLLKILANGSPDSLLGGVLARTPQLHVKLSVTHDILWGALQ